MDYDPKDLKSVLAYMRETFGAGVFEEPPRMFSILLDLAPGLERDGNVLRQMSTKGLLRELRTASENGAEYERIRLTAKSRSWLIDYLMLSDDKADYFMTALQAAYGLEAETPKPAPPPIISVPNGNIVASGRTGNCTWKLDSNYTFTVSGHGQMANYSNLYYSADRSPCWNYRESIKVVVIERGVTSIGEWAFCECSALKSVTIPDSVISIKLGAFSGCFSLINVTIPDSVTFIEWGAFSGCRNLNNVNVSGRTIVSPTAFDRYTQIIRR